MKYLKIQNAGELDIRLVALMGGSTKTNDRYKIGKFGTGLKYTLAFLFRNNLDFKIFSGENLIDVSLEEENIKDEVFEIVCINKNRTSITTKMGLDWTAWMILRELWCNALDEGQESKEVTFVTDETKSELLVGEAEKTTFFIQINDEIKSVLDNWSDYFIQNEKPMFENENYGIYENNNGKLKIYKQGVLIYQHPEAKSLFKYDIKKADINELREFKGSVSYEVLEALSNPNKEVISHFLANVKEFHYEGSEMDYSWFQSFCEIWRTTIGDSKLSYYTTTERSDENRAITNIEGVISLPKKVYKALTKNFEGIGAIGVSDRKEEFHEVRNKFLKEKINTTLANLIDCGYEYDLEIKFVTGVFDEKIRMGTNKRENKVLVSAICLDMEDFKFSCLLIEHIELIKIQESELKKHFIEKYTTEIFKQQSVVSQ